MKTKSYFLSLSTTVIILNILLGLGSIFLVERIQPAINKILEENAYSVSAAISMLEAISDHQENLLAEAQNQDAEPEAQILFWDNFENAKKNITLANETKIIQEIEKTATLFWSGDVTQKPELKNLISELAHINLKDMQKKRKKAESLSITGAWGLGFLLIFSLVLQLIFRSKILSGMIEPMEQIYNVLKDFSEGNPLRRFVEQKDNLMEIKKTGYLINTILDKSNEPKK